MTMPGSRLKLALPDADRGKVVAHRCISGCVSGQGRLARHSMRCEQMFRRMRWPSPPVLRAVPIELSGHNDLEPKSQGRLNAVNAYPGATHRFYNAYDHLARASPVTLAVARLLVVTPVVMSTRMPVVMRAAVPAIMLAIMPAIPWTPVYSTVPAPVLAGVPVMVRAGIPVVVLVVVMSLRNACQAN